MFSPSLTIEEKKTPTTFPTQKKTQELEYCAFFNDTKHAEYNFLSNFYLRIVKSDRYGTFRCSEGLYQYQKFAYLNDQALLERFKSADGQAAFDLSRELAGKVDPIWNKVEAMQYALNCKFKDEDLKRKLLKTQKAYLVENSPNGHDSFWADNGDGSGKNMLGMLLMQLRLQSGGTGVVPQPAILDLFYSHKCDHCTNCSHFTNDNKFYNYCDSHMTHDLILGDVKIPIHLSDIPSGTGRFLYFKTNSLPELVTEGARLIADRIASLKLQSPYFVAPGDSTTVIAHELITKYDIPGVVLGKTKKPTDIETFSIDYCAITSTEVKSLYLPKDEADKMTNRDIVIFDNVCTTGETLKAVYELLLKAGVNCNKISESIVLFTEGYEEKSVAISAEVQLPLHSFCYLPLFPTDPYVDKSQYRMYSAATLPTTRGTSTLAVFHDRTGREKDAIAFYPVKTFDKGRKNIPVRVHDACATSELFDSVKCDCKLQLDHAKDYIAKHGGIIIYLNQEGRGIGLGNKIAAYNLQQTQGLDTVMANRALGLPDDIRKYEAVRDILKSLKVESIKLITNNPRKVRCLTDLGVTVEGNIPSTVEANYAPMQFYMQTKNKAMGHTISLAKEVKQEMVFVMGGPGSGKGTHCKRLAESKDYCHISTGDLFRNVINNPESMPADIVQQIKENTEKGRLNDDKLTLTLLKAEIAKHPYAHGFLIDGYPRTMGQMQLFEKEIGKCNKVLYFDVSEADMMNRIVKRGAEEHRADDNITTFMTRYQIFASETLPVIEYQRENYADNFIKIDTSAGIDEVAANVTKLFSENNKKPVIASSSISQILVQNSGRYKQPDSTSTQVETDQNKVNTSSITLRNVN